MRVHRDLEACARLAQGYICSCRRGWGIPPQGSRLGGRSAWGLVAVTARSATRVVEQLRLVRQGAPPPLAPPLARAPMARLAQQVLVSRHGPRPRTRLARQALVPRGLPRLGALWVRQLPQQARVTVGQVRVWSVLSGQALVPLVGPRLQAQLVQQTLVPLGGPRLQAQLVPQTLVPLGCPRLRALLVRQTHRPVPRAEAPQHLHTCRLSNALRTACACIRAFGNCRQSAASLLEQRSRLRSSSPRRLFVWAIAYRNPI